MCSVRFCGVRICSFAQLAVSRCAFAVSRFAIRTFCSVGMSKRVSFVVHFVQFVVEICGFVQFAIAVLHLVVSRFAVSQFAMPLFFVFVPNLRCQDAQMCSSGFRGISVDLQFAQSAVWRCVSLYSLVQSR
jgi:type IV secretory pathway VirB3-like protein